MSSRAHKPNASVVPPEIGLLLEEHRAGHVLQQVATHLSSRAPLSFFFPLLSSPFLSVALLSSLLETRSNKKNTQTQFTLSHQASSPANASLRHRANGSAANTYYVLLGTSAPRVSKERIKRNSFLDRTAPHSPLPARSSRLPWARRRGRSLAERQTKLDSLTPVATHMPPVKVTCSCE